LNIITNIITIDNASLSREHKGMYRRCTVLSSITALVVFSIVIIPSSYIFPVHTCQAFQAVIEDPAANFEQHAQYLYETIGLKKRGLDLDLFRYALVGYFNLKRRGALSKEGIISIIDFRKSCNENRFYVIDLARHKVIYHTLVAHGRHSGNIYARHFSNKRGSLKSSIGFFVTGDTYDGEHGYSLYLDGMDAGFNDNARARGIVIHGAYYVGRTAIKQYGRIGRSQGCPALPAGTHIDIIDTIARGTCLFQFYSDRQYLERSILLDAEEAVAQFAEEYSPFIQIKVPDR
jgi:hypothetical protein